MDLTNQNISYMIISSERIDDLMSVLYAKSYQILPLQGFYRGNYENSVFAYSNSDNDDLRKDVIFLLNQFHQESAIIKYMGETSVKKIFKDGQEKPLGITLYNTDSENMSYLLNGVSFSFVEQKRYWKPQKQEDFKVGMIVEYFNKDKWFQKKIEDPNSEWEKFFKLLVKYDKVRVPSTK